MPLILFLMWAVQRIRCATRLSFGAWLDESVDADNGYRAEDIPGI